MYHHLNGVILHLKLQLILCLRSLSFWDITLYWWVKEPQHFKTKYIIFKGQNVQEEFFFYIASKYWARTAHWQSVISQQDVVLSCTTVETAKFAHQICVYWTMLTCIIFSIKHIYILLNCCPFTERCTFLNKKSGNKGTQLDICLVTDDNVFFLVKINYISLYFIKYVQHWKRMKI